MNTTCIIQRSAIEERYDRAREDFNYQYDNSPYKLKCKEFYLGGGVENYEVASQILSMNEKEIAKSYLEDCDPKEWESMRKFRNYLMCDATDIYKTAIDMVKSDIQKLETIQGEVENFLKKIFYLALYGFQFLNIGFYHIDSRFVDVRGIAHEVVPEFPHAFPFFRITIFKVGFGYFFLVHR